jgi:predicted 3-demethylubiquinone-9 3-methyltransferase (glyoxalase superfamily)/uncharacterized protein YndB with AHSA1/START domain
MSNSKAAAFARPPVVIERLYRARAEDLWELWTTKQGFESWWGPAGFRVEVHAIDARAGGLLHYDMIADTPEMTEAMRRMGRPPSHGTRARYVELDLHRHIVITHVIDFLPGVQAYDSTLRVNFCASGDYVRMVVTLEPMHDQAFTDMSAMGFSSQLGKLNARFERMPAASGTISPLPAVTPFLMFAGQAEEAMTWYVSLIGNSAILSIERYGEAGPGTAGSVLQARFSLNGREFICIDSPVKHQFTFTPSFSLLVDCASEAEVDRLFAALSADGSVMMPLGSYPFSKRFAWFADKYGVSWQLRLCP